MARVFLSYRRVEPDQSVAKFIHRHLVDLDHNIFLDAGISVGTDWHKEIQLNIEQSEWFIPFVSSHYLSSEYIVRQELLVAGRLLKQKKMRGILPINLAYDGDLPEAVKKVLGQLQWIKWRRSEDTLGVAKNLASRLPPSNLLVKGMRPFSLTDGSIFENLGRAEQVVRFTSLLKQAANRLILLHGISDCGKSSLVKAGVVPKMPHR